MSGQWTHDDPSIPDDAELLRSVWLKPDCWGLDAISGKKILLPGALQFDDDDGMSVHFTKLVEELGHQAQAVRKSTDHALARFPTSSVRAGTGGVIHEADEDDAVFGEAHGLVRAIVPRPDRQTKKLIRNAIAKSAVWVIEPA